MVRKARFVPLIDLEPFFGRLGYPYLVRIQNQNFIFVLRAGSPRRELYGIGDVVIHHVCHVGIGNGG